MKILFITDLIPINNEKMTSALFEFVKEWTEQGHIVDVIRPNIMFNTLIRGRRIIKEKEYIRNGIPILNLNFISPFWFNIHRKLPKNFSLKNYDVMISHMPAGALLANKLLKKEKIKYICSVHASDITVLKNLKYFFFRKQLKSAYINADRISARSPVLQKKIEEIFPEIQEKTFVAYSGINEKIIEKPINTKTVEITTVASLIKRKNIDVIIKALTMIKQDYHFTIMGDGNQKKHLQKLVNKYNLANKISFLGHVKKEEVTEKLKKSDIFILVSDNETFGLCYLEAMATGNIIIAKKDDGIDGILQHEQNAFLTEANPLSLRNTIEKILSLKDTELDKIQKNAINTVSVLTLKNASENYINNIM